MPRIFISYRRSDTLEFVDRIAKDLKNKFDSESVFLDFDDIPLGVDFEKHIDLHMQKCDVLIVSIGKYWAADKDGASLLAQPSDFVRLEIEAALRRQIPIIPLLVSGAQIPRKESLPDTLERLPYYQAHEVRPGPDYDNDFKKLVYGINFVNSQPKKQSNDSLKTQTRTMSNESRSIGFWTNSTTIRGVLVAYVVAIVFPLACLLAIAYLVVSVTSSTYAERDLIEKSLISHYKIEDMLDKNLELNKMTNNLLKKHLELTSEKCYKENINMYENENKQQ